jgi:hypothetical protein
MSFIKRTLWPVFRFICIATVGHGLLLYLASKGIHPDQSVAAIIGYAESVSVAEAVWFIMIGSFGLIGGGITEIFWPSVRTKIRKHRQKTFNASNDADHPIIVTPTIHTESPRLREISKEISQSPILWDNTFYLVLQNGNPNRTVRNVSVQINTVESIERCPIKGTNTFKSDIRHGDYIYFRLGRVVSAEFSGLPGGGLAGEVVRAEEMKGYVQRIQNGLLSFEPTGNPVKFSGRLDRPGKVKWTFPVIITGDDLPSRTVALSIDMRTSKVDATLNMDISPTTVSFSDE